MSVRRLKAYLRRLLREDRTFDGGVVETVKGLAQGRRGVTAAERKFLTENFLEKYRDRFDSGETARDLTRFLSPWGEKRGFVEGFFEAVRAIPGNVDLVLEMLQMQLRQFWKCGRARPSEIRRAREAARKVNYYGSASLRRLDPRSGWTGVEAALKKAIEDIEGWEFLSLPPEGRAENEHTVLIKVGVNWGIALYPTVTSPESVYAVTKMCLEEARIREAAVRVIVGDQSGNEIKMWWGTTRHNLEHTGILRAAVLAGLDYAAAREEEDPDQFPGAGEMARAAWQKEKITWEEEDQESAGMIAMAGEAGVEVVCFDDQEFKRVPVPGVRPRHFREGVLVPKMVDEEVTDIINLPKPPGRHCILGNTGLTGAMKNHIGLVGAGDRTSKLHGPWLRFTGPEEAGEGESRRARLQELQRRIQEDATGRAARQIVPSLGFNWKEHGGKMPFHEAVVEAYLVFAARERFSVADLRRTVSTFGPDLGRTMDIGAVIAASDPDTLDVLAGVLLKRRYEEIGSWFDALKPGGGTFAEYIAGRTWLSKGTPFDLMGHIAANSYQVGPVDIDHIEFPGGFEDAGFRARELEAIARHLGRRGFRIN